jgi:acylphosphatase
MTDSAPDRQRIHAIVSGRVQGVSFRYYTMQTARRLHLTGWVCNRSDGTVEAVAEGKSSALEQLVTFLHKGPPAAYVDHVQLEWLAPRGDFNSFEIRHFW